MNKLLLPILTIFSLSAMANTYVVKLKKNVNSLTALTSNSAVNQIEVKLSFGNYVSLNFKGQSLVDENEALNEIRNNPNVLYVEPIRTYHAFGENIDDPKFTQQWGLENTGRNSRNIFMPGKKGVDIKAKLAWEISKGSNEIKVAVIDTGVDYNHSDLKENILINEAELNGKDGVDDDNNGYIDDVYGWDFSNNDNDPMDDHGHGTHCAGTIGASHNSIGIRGVMANVKILPLKFLSAKGSGTSEAAAKAIDYAISRKVNVMSNSWGGGPRSKILEDAIIAANNAGIVFVAAAGNERSNNDQKDSFPANYKVDNVISVGALDGRGAKASFSNYGHLTVHLFAPGVNILSTVINDSYKKMSGTSMACPFVAGAAGLLLSTNPAMTPLEVKNRLMKTTDRERGLNAYSQSGSMNIFKMLRN